MIKQLAKSVNVEMGERDSSHHKVQLLHNLWVAIFIMFIYIYTAQQAELIVISVPFVLTKWTSACGT